MNIKTLIGLVGLLGVLTVNSAQADPHRRGYNHSGHHGHHRNHVVEARLHTRLTPARSAISHSSAVRAVLPIGFVRVVHAGETYYYHDGFYYSQYYSDNRHGFIEVRPAAGVRVAHLPAGHLTLRVDGESLYQFNDVRYRFNNGVYIVI